MSTAVKRGGVVCLMVKGGSYRRVCPLGKEQLQGPNGGRWKVGTMADWESPRPMAYLGVAMPYHLVTECLRPVQRPWNQKRDTFGGPPILPVFHASVLPQSWGAAGSDLVAAIPRRVVLGSALHAQKTGVLKMRLFSRCGSTRGRRRGRKARHRTRAFQPPDRRAAHNEEEDLFHDSVHRCSGPDARRREPVGGRPPAGGRRAVPDDPDPHPYGNAGMNASDSALLAKGYALVKQDCRGRFDSEGRFDPCARTRTGTTPWRGPCGQPWCDGRLGMLGGSYGGLTQLTAAWTRPPGLLAIAPAVMGRDLFKDLAYHNGVFGLAIAVGWGLAVAGRSAQTNDTTDWDRVFRHLPLLTMDEAAGYRLPYLREWLSHPTYDAYWAGASVEQHYGDFDVPILHAGGWYDFYGDGWCATSAAFAPGAGRTPVRTRSSSWGPGDTAWGGERSDNSTSERRPSREWRASSSGGSTAG